MDDDCSVAKGMAKRFVVFCKMLGLMDASLKHPTLNWVAFGG